MNLKIKFFVLITLVSVGLIHVSAQTKASALQEIADTFYTHQKYDSASIYFEQVIPVLKSTKEWGRATHCLRRYFSSNNQIDDYEKIRQSEKDAILLSTIPQLRDSVNLSDCFFFLAYAFEKKGNYMKALSYYKNAIELYEYQNATGAYVALTHLNAGQIAIRNLDYPKAIEYFKKGLNNPYKRYSASMWGALASAYYFQDAYEMQLECIQKGFEEDYSNQTLAVLNLNQARYFIKKKEYKKAEKFLLENLDLYEKQGSHWVRSAAVYLEFVKIYEGKKEKEQSDLYIQKVEKGLEQSGPNKNRSKAELCVKIAEYYFRNHQLDLSNIYFQKALTQIFPEFNETAILKNPDLSSVYTESWTMDAAAGKANVLKAQFESDGDLNKLETAFECYQIVIATIDELYKSYGTESSKIYIKDYGYNYFEEAIEIQYLLFENTKDEKYLKNILSLMGQSKANVLSEAIQKNKAIYEAAIPDSLLDVEKELRNLIAEKKLNLVGLKQIQKEDNQNRVDLAELELADLNNKYIRHITDLKKRFPKFQSLSESENIPSIREIQNKMKQEETVFIEFFEGAKNIYSLTVFPEQVKLNKLEKSEQINNLLHKYLFYFNDANQFINDPSTYYDCAYELYKSLLPDLSKDAKAFQKIIIVPDGILKRLPFEALVDQDDVKGIARYDQYLLNNYTIYYSNSSGFVFNEKFHDKPGNNTLYLAPGFENNERDLPPLLHGELSATSMHNPHKLFGLEATLVGFKKEVEQSNIIHLSTHATSDSELGIPKIEFIDTSLFLPEIYALNFNADLVVLSACETQLGELKKGEGIMSLARGFFYAGASSLIASLWSVNDKSTATIFSNFYNELNNDQSKAEALRTAKLNYLKEAKSDLKKSPYYWAGFVYIGQNEKVSSRVEYGISKWGLFLGLGIGLIGLLYFMFFRKTSS